MNPTKFRIKNDGDLEIVTGDRFEVINMANGETVGGNTTHLPEIRTQGIAFAKEGNPGDRAEYQKLPLAGPLADKFSELLRTELGDVKIHAVNLRNWSYGYSNEVCASHDFRDANQVMLDAMKCFGLDFYLQDEQQIELINTAWVKAKKNHFRPLAEVVDPFPFEALGQKLRKANFDFCGHAAVEECLQCYDELPSCYAAAELMLDVLRRIAAMMDDPDADDHFTGARIEKLIAETIEFAESDQVIEA